MKRRRKQTRKTTSIAGHHVQPIGLLAGGNSIGIGNYQELVGIYVIAILLFVAFSFWFSFGMFQ